mmetsp:Transcript_7476/g.13403  ORF Transcript_7476/g.13403 Transcript_7476/m.13403 type:complete len:138 (+) Transcript_7476:42-455(+)
MVEVNKEGDAVEAVPKAEAGPATEETEGEDHPAQEGDAVLEGPSLANALLKTENRSPAFKLFMFAVALAVLPVCGLLVCERCLRTVVLSEAHRWTCSAVVAVVLVNAVLVAYVVSCFYEDDPSVTKPQAVEGDKKDQ